MFKTRLVRSAAVVFAAGAVLFFIADDAQAQGCGYGGYGSGLSINIGSGYGGYSAYRGYGSGGYGRHVGVSRYYRRPPVWHDTSHFDYHPGRLVPHGNHLDYVPGHFHLHRTGHWHH